MDLHGRSQKITYFGNNVLCLDFIDSPQNHCLFHQSPSKIIHIVGSTCKKIVKIGYQSRGESVSAGCEISINSSMDEMITYFGNWLKKFIFQYFQRNFFYFYYLQYILLRMCDIARTRATIPGNFVIPKSSVFLSNLLFHTCSFTHLGPGDSMEDGLTNFGAQIFWGGP